MLFNNQGQRVTLPHNANDLARSRVREVLQPDNHHQGVMFRVVERLSQPSLRSLLTFVERSAT